MILLTPGLIPGIQAVGYAPYDYGNHSDHRAILIDIDSSVMFGTRP